MAGVRVCGSSPTDGRSRNPTLLIASPDHFHNSEKEQERARAKEYGYEDPIQPTFDDTSRNYEENLVMCFNEIKSRDKKCMKIVAASHNEDTVRFGVTKYNI